MNQTQKIIKKPKRNYTRTIDLAFILVYVIAIIYTFLTFKKVNILPTIYHYLFLGVAFLIFVYFFQSALKKYHKGFVYLKRVILSLIIIAMLAISYTLQNFQASFDSLSKQTNQMYLLSHSEQPTTIGLQMGSDYKKSTSLKETLTNDYNASFYEANSYEELLNAYEEGQIDAFLISNAYYLKYLSSNPTFQSTYPLLTTYQYEVQQSSQLPPVFSVYLSGIDTMGSPDQLTRSDTNILVIVDSIRNRLSLISIPRDAYIPNSALNYANDKFTHTALYGIDTSVESLQNFLDIPIDYYARISFQSLISIVDILDGVEVDVEIDFCEQDENRSFKQDDLICLNAGKQTLNGKQALAYARHRKTANYDNAGRERAQKRIIKAMIDKITSPSIVLRINDLLSDMNEYLMTNISSKAITSFISSELDELSEWEIVSVPTNIGVYDYQYCASNDISLGTSSVYLYAYEEVKMIQDIYDGANTDINFDDYSFDINNLYADNDPTYLPEGQIVWSSMALFPH